MFLRHIHLRYACKKMIEGYLADHVKKDPTHQFDIKEISRLNPVSLTFQPAISSPPTSADGCLANLLLA